MSYTGGSCFFPAPLFLPTPLQLEQGHRSGGRLGGRVNALASGAPPKMSVGIWPLTPWAARREAFFSLGLGKKTWGKKKWLREWKKCTLVLLSLWASSFCVHRNADLWDLALVSMPSLALSTKHLITSRFSCWRGEDRRLDLIQPLSITDEPKAVLEWHITLLLPIALFLSLPLLDALRKGSGRGTPRGWCAAAVPVSLCFTRTAAAVLYGLGHLERDREPSSLCWGTKSAPLYQPEWDTRHLHRQHGGAEDPSGTGGSGAPARQGGWDDPLPATSLKQPDWGC